MCTKNFFAITIAIMCQVVRAGFDGTGGNALPGNTTGSRGKISVSLEGMVFRVRSGQATIAFTTVFS
jgi:hypothetical protein